MRLLRLYSPVVVLVAWALLAAVNVTSIGGLAVTLAVALFLHTRELHALHFARPRRHR